MTPEEQRIAIAEACGLSTFPLNATWGRGLCERDDGTPTTLPDYPNDLNAMHEVEKTLTDRQWFHEIKDSQEGEICYWTCLWHIVARDSKTNGSTRLRHEATARQRAEAFLRTLNLWVE
jgi:hypothetical protein